MFTTKRNSLAGALAFGLFTVFALLMARHKGHIVAPGMAVGLLVAATVPLSLWYRSLRDPAPSYVPVRVASAMLFIFTLAATFMPWMRLD